MAVDRIDNRFGSIAIRKGYITAEQLIDALNQQVRENVYKNQHRLIGSILREMKYLTVEQIDEILTEMI
jgi:hypothetical protein